MLRPVVVLSVLSLLAGSAVADTYNGPSQADISTCPITFYGQQYKHIFVSYPTDKVAICFDKYYDPNGEGDCILGPAPTNSQADIQTWNKNSEIDYEIKQALSSFTNDLVCHVFLTFVYSGSQLDFILSNYGTQAAVSTQDNAQRGTKSFDFQVMGKNEATLTVTPTNSYLDISSCRQSGQLYGPNKQLSSDPATCETVSCSATSEIVTTTCSAGEKCQGNNVCTVDQICTVTGPSVVDFGGEVHYVEDRCHYTLVASPSFPGVSLSANFQERRRKDVNFLDSVTVVLSQSNSSIHLEQGGSIRVDDTVLVLTNSSQTVNGVEISQDDTGVTVEVPASEYSISLFFDGTTAQVFLTGPSGQDLSVNGLCSNSNGSVVDNLLPEDIGGSCGAQFTDDPDSSINCTTATEFCNGLTEGSFSSCNSVVDPQPYIDACTKTLCGYPSVDGVDCAFPAAYARACGLYGTLVSNDCSTSPSSCQDRPCTSNEFCGTSNSDQSGCLCRAVFASPYRESNTLGDPTVCSSNSASLTLVGCLLEEQGIDYSTLHLNDPTCTGQIDEQNHKVTFTYDNINTCGTEVSTNDSQIIYTNAVTNLNSDTGLIVRHDQVYFDFTCIQTQPDMKTMSFKIRDSSVVVHVTSEAWNYDLAMNAYTDSKRTHALDSNTAVLLDQRIWVELSTTGLDENLISVVTDSCWATPDPSPTGDLRYDLIVNGCPNPEDATVSVFDNGSGTSNYFSFKMFQFTGQSGDLYLHCNLQLCVENCVPECGARRRRSLVPKYKSAHSALISMAWVN